MTTIRTNVRVNSEGNVVIPVGPAEAGRDVIVTVVPAPPTMTQKEWEEFIDRTAGSIDDPSFQRPPQGEYEEREPLE